MKKIFSLLALTMISAMSWAAVKINVNPSTVDFGTVNILGYESTGLEGSMDIVVTWTGIEAGSCIYAQVTEGDYFYLSGGDDAFDENRVICGLGYGQHATSVTFTVHYYVNEAKTFNGKVRVWAYDGWDEAETIVNVKLVTVADVPKTIPFERINTTSELKDGDIIVFVNENQGAVSGPLYTTYLTAIQENVTINKSTGKADVPETAQMFSAKKYSGNWQFYTTDTEQRLNLDASSKGAFTFADPSSTVFANWGVSISSGVADVSKPDGTFPVEFNGDRFKPYKNAGSGSSIALYKKAGDPQELESKLTVGDVVFGDVELDDQKAVTVNYTAENLTDDIAWGIEGSDAALFDVSDTGDRTSGTVTVTYKGNGTKTGSVNAQLAYLTQDAKYTTMEGSKAISINLIAGTVKLTKIEFSGAPTQIEQGQSIDMSQYIVYTPNNAADKSLTWTTDHDYQGTVDANGVLTAKHVTGNVTVTATSVRVPSVSASATLQIVKPVITDFTLSDSEVTLNIGGTKQLSITSWTPSYASESATYASKDAAIASVNKNGLITAKAIGETEITATIGEVVKTCKVKVVAVTVENIELPAEANLTLGSFLQLTPVVTPAQAASEYTISYVSDNESVATVSESGLVEGKAEGDAVITATISDKSAQITIHVVGAKLFAKVAAPGDLAAKDTIILATTVTINSVQTPIVAGVANTSKNCLEIISEGVTLTENAAYADNALVMVIGGQQDQFTLTAVGSNNMLASSDNTKLGYSSSKNNTWRFEAGTDGVMVANASYTTKDICYNSQSKYIRMYAPGTNSTPLYVYVRKYVDPSTTGIEATEGIQPANIRKILRNGQLMIIRDGKTYTVTGVMIDD